MKTMITGDWSIRQNGKNARKTGSGASICNILCFWLQYGEFHFFTAFNRILTFMMRVSNKASSFILPAHESHGIWEEQDVLTTSGYKKTTDIPRDIAKFVVVILLTTVDNESLLVFKGVGNTSYSVLYLDCGVDNPPESSSKTTDYRTGWVIFLPGDR